MTTRSGRWGRRFLLVLLMLAALPMAVTAAPPEAAPPSMPGNPGVPGLLAEIDALAATITEHDARIAELQAEIAQLEALVDVAASSRLVATGQTTCFDSNLFVFIDCAGTGLDGEIRAGAPLSYTDNGDGTVTDNNTGLMWQKTTTFSQYTWREAFDVHIAGLNATAFAGFTDWRMPNVKELASIVEYEILRHPTIAPEFCAGRCSAGLHWTSTIFPPQPEAAMVVNFTDGAVVAMFTRGRAEVRAVRGGLSR